MIRNRASKTGAIGTLVAILTLLPASATAAKRGLEPTDFYSETTISETAISPAGDLVAFVVMTIVEQDNKRHREIWMQRLDGSRPDGEMFRFTAPTDEASSPRWSPDGSLLSFRSKRGDDDNEIWFLRLAPPGGEAFHIEGVDSQPLWSPDGEWIALVREPDDEEEEESDSEDDAEKPAVAEGADKKKREGWIASDAISSTLDAERFDGRVITSMRSKRDGTLTLLPHPEVRKKKQLFVVASSGGEPTAITDLSFNVNAPLWSADSGHLLFTGDELEDDEHNRDYTSDIFRVARQGGEAQRMTSGLGSERSLAVSPNGARLAYLYSRERGEPVDLMVLDLERDGSFASEGRNLTAEWHLAPGAPRWTVDGQSLQFTSQTGGNRQIFEAAAQGGPITQRSHGERTIMALSAARDTGQLAYAATDSATPTELFVAGPDATGEHRLSSFNDDWLEDITRMPAERLSWTVEDGSEIEGWLVPPVGYQAGGSYPMILKIHGGPHGAYGNTWFRTFHVLSASGFFVLYTNPRGSTGYGHDFTYATRGRWGEMDSEDYLAGVDAALARYPDIDPDRIGVSGGSYGGFMTAWLSATSDRFAAANPSRMIVNWESWYGSSDAQGLTEHEFFGEPWEQRELYRRLSPITYVENVTAPTLIIHSENDYRTPIGDGEQWFMALKKRRVPVELVRYPRSSHGLSRTGEPWLLVDRLERIRSWFVHWLAIGGNGEYHSLR